jgi:formylglycine-generating enzyme required for sulfatase activity
MPGIPSSMESKTAQPKELSPPSRAVNEPAQPQAKVGGGNGDVHAGVVGRPDAGPALKTHTSQESIKNSIGMTLKLIPAGEFMMGSPNLDMDALPDEKPQHWLRITRPFYMGVTEVTQGQYRAITGQNPSSNKGSDDLPAENVSWIGAIAFCNRLSAKEELTPYYQIAGETVTVLDGKGTGYRLPTEAEWEYACRAGSPFRFSFGDDDLSLPWNQMALGQHAWFDGNNSNDWSHPVGQRRPNAFGLYDMHGNVWEWCWDGYDGSYYASSPAHDPPGPSRFTDRVNRGGCWNDDPRVVRAAYRSGRPENDRAGTQGFRVAVVPVGEPPVSPAAKRAVNEPAQLQAKVTARTPSRTAHVLSGSWRVEEKELVQKDREGTIHLGDKELSTYDLKFQGQIVAGKEGFVALLHCTNDETFRFFHVGELGGKEAQSGFLYEGKERGKAKPISTMKGRWYDVLVKVRGAESWCFLDGQELFHEIDERFTHGRVGLATWHASARFREITITTPDGDVLWSGLPQLLGN